MAGQKRIFDDMARVASGAASALGGFRSRMEGELRETVERILARMNLVTREDHEVVAALAAKARAEQEMLAERVAVLEAKLGIARKAAGQKTAGKGKAKPKAAKEPARRTKR